MLVFLSIWKDLLQQFLADMSEEDILESGFYGRGTMKHNNISVSTDKQPLKLAPVKLDPFLMIRYPRTERKKKTFSLQAEKCWLLNTSCAWWFCHCLPSPALSTTYCKDKTQESWQTCVSKANMQLIYIGWRLGFNGKHVRVNASASLSSTNM